MLERPAEARVRTYLTHFAADGSVEQIDVTARLCLAHYCVVMDFDGARLLYTERRAAPRAFCVVVHELREGGQTRLEDIGEATLLRFFGEGLVYVQKQKRVLLYDLHLRSSQLLQHSPLSIVALGVDRESGRIAWVDKGGNVSVWELAARRLLLARQPLKALAGVGEAARGYRDFEMGYAYHAAIGGALFAYSGDFGIFVARLLI